MLLAKTSSAEIDALLYPARAFRHPMDVVRDPDLTLYEKRAILSSWASDACAVEDFPEFRQPSGAAPVKFDDIMDALRGLDAELERRASSQCIGWCSDPRRESGEPPALQRLDEDGNNAI
jgi:hypothetical protein